MLDFKIRILKYSIFNIKNHRRLSALSNIANIAWKNLWETTLGVKIAKPDTWEMRLRHDSAKREKGRMVTKQLNDKSSLETFRDDKSQDPTSIF